MHEDKTGRMVERFPKACQELPTGGWKRIGVALYDAQRGGKAPTAKPFKDVASGVFEIAIRFDKDAYRAVYTAQIGSWVHVLHAFQKKSKRGAETPKPDVDLIRQRYKQALEMEEAE